MFNKVNTLLALAAVLAVPHAGLGQTRISAWMHPLTH